MWPLTSQEKIWQPEPARLSAMYGMFSKGEFHSKVTQESKSTTIARKEFGSSLSPCKNILMIVLFLKRKVKGSQKYKEIKNQSKSGHRKFGTFKHSSKLLALDFPPLRLSWSTDTHRCLHTQPYMKLSGSCTYIYLLPRVLHQSYQRFQGAPLTFWGVHSTPACLFHGQPAVSPVTEYLLWAGSQL